MFLASTERKICRLHFLRVRQRNRANCLDFFHKYGFTGTRANDFKIVKKKKKYVSPRSWNFSTDPQKQTYAESVSPKYMIKINIRKDDILILLTVK